MSDPSTDSQEPRRIPLLHRVHKIRKQGAMLHLRLWRLISSPLFLWVTVIFHSIIIVAAWLLQIIETGHNPHVTSYVNTLYWAVATVTTVGYGDIVPITAYGKILAVLLMITGPVFSAIYTAMFASALLAGEFEEVERDVRGVKSQFRELEREVRDDEEHIERLLAELRGALTTIKRRAGSDDGRRS